MEREGGSAVLIERADAGDNNGTGKDKGEASGETNGRCHGPLSFSSVDLTHSTWTWVLQMD